MRAFIALFALLACGADPGSGSVDPVAPVDHLGDVELFEGSRLADARAFTFRDPARAGAPGLVMTALPWTRTVTCTGSVTITGTATNVTSVAWSASPDGASGACTGTTSWSCAAAVSPNADGEGVETITITATGLGGTSTSTVDVGYYVTGSHSCFLAQSYDGAYNVGKTDGTAVATWENLGSSAFDLTQGTGTQQPLYKTPVKNTQPMIRLDGTNDNMTNATAANWLFMYDGTASTQEVVFVTTDANPNALYPLVMTAQTASSGAAKGSSLFYDDRSASSQEDRIRYSVSNGTALNYALISADDEVPAQTYNYVSAICSDDGGAGNDGFIYTNNILSVQGTRANAYATTATTALFVGANGALSQFLKGDIWRILIYTSALTSTQRGINLAVDQWALGGTFPLAYVSPPFDSTKWVLVGDSLTAGALGVTPYPTKLAAYAPTKTLVVDATGGDKTFEIFNSWRDATATFTPEMVFVLGGINNIRTDQTAAETFFWLQRIYTEARARGVQVVAMQTPPFKGDSAWTSARQAQLELLMPMLASSTDINVLVDFYVGMGDRPTNPERYLPAYNGGDSLHPSEAGTTYMADDLKAALGL